MKLCLGSALSRCLWVLTVTAAGPAFADDAKRDVQRADVLFQEGRSALLRGDYAIACKKLEESEYLDPAAGTLLNLVVVRGAPRQAGEGVHRLVESAIKPGPKADQLAECKKEAARLERRLPRIVLHAPDDAPEGTTVTLDDAELEDLSAPIPVDPGPHVIVVRARGPRGQDEIKVNLNESGDRDPEAGESEACRGGPPGDTPKPDAEARKDPGPERDRAHSHGGVSIPTSAWLLGGVGVVGLGVLGAAWFGARWKSANDEARAICFVVPGRATLFAVGHRLPQARSSVVHTPTRRLRSAGSFVGGAALAAAVR